MGSGYMERVEPIISTNAFCLKTAHARSFPCFSRIEERDCTCTCGNLFGVRELQNYVCSEPSANKITDSAPTTHAGDDEATSEGHIASFCCGLWSFERFCFSVGRRSRGRRREETLNCFRSPSKPTCAQENIIPLGAPRSDQCDN